MSDSFVKWDAYLQVASLSDLGMRRTSNQDNLCISFASNFEHWQRRGHLFVVADGMGAHAAGELASKIAVDTIPHLYGKYLESGPAEALRRSIAETNAEIHRRGQANEEFHNMGTTCTALMLLPEGAVSANVGDSRVYRLRGNQFDQLTFDHSLVWEMQQAGQLFGREELLRIPKNVITRSLGPNSIVNVDLEGPFPIQVDDVFLLCTDGLTGQVNDEEIGAILANLSPSEAAQTLVDIANLRGGPDNTTVIVVKVAQPQLATSPGLAAAGNGSLKVKAASIALLVVSLVLTGLLFWLLENRFAWLIPAGIALASLIWILIQALLSLNPLRPAAASFGRLGKGPYAHADCTASGWQFVDKMQEMIREISQTIEEKGWKIDQVRWQNLHGAATQAIEKRDLPEAIRGYSRATVFLMDQLRHQKAVDESGVDL